MLIKLGRGLSALRAGTDDSGGGQPPAATYLDSVIASACCDLDAAIAESYPGSGQTWANLIASPADGAAQSDYDFFLGADGNASTDDPTWNEAGYFELDGFDYFASVNFANMPTLFNMHKSGTAGTQWWTAFAYRPGSTFSRALWGSGFQGADIGLYAFVDPDGTTKQIWRPDESSGNQVIFDVPAYDTETDVLVITSADMTATADNVKMWVRGAGDTISKNYGNYAVDNDNAVFAIGATYDEGVFRSRQDAGTRIHHFSAGNEFLDDTKAGAIIAHLEARHGRSYMP